MAVRVDSQLSGCTKGVVADPDEGLQAGQLGIGIKAGEVDPVFALEVRDPVPRFFPGSTLLDKVIDKDVRTPIGKVAVGSLGMTDQGVAFASAQEDVVSGCAVDPVRPIWVPTWVRFAVGHRMSVMSLRFLLLNSAL